MSDKIKKRRRDSLKAAVVAELENCSYRLEFIIQTVISGASLSDSTFTREGLAITLKDLQAKLGDIRKTLRLETAI